MGLSVQAQVHEHLLQLSRIGVNHLEIGRLHNSDVKILSNDFSQKTHLFSDKKIEVTLRGCNISRRPNVSNWEVNFAARWDCSRIFRNRSPSLPVAVFPFSIFAVYVVAFWH
jgi:hypothetical protein